MTGDTRKRTFGLAAILVVGTIAGFLAAAGTSGADYATVGTVAESQAFQMPVEEEDQRVRFALEADQSTATEPLASFALYDPADEFFTEFELSGQDDEVEAILDEPGQWVLFVTEQRNAELQVQYETEDDEQIELQQLEVQDERTVVAEQDGGSLDEQVAFRVDHRPASALLTFEGDIEDLDATVASEEGPVYELADASANTTEGQRSGDVTVTSVNLAAGTYEVQAQASSFDGELAFVHQSYERVEQTDTEETETEVEEQNVSTYAEDEDGAIVAELDEGQAHEIDTAGAQEITFLADEDVSADLMMYNESDRLVKQIQIERDGYEWEEDESEENESDEQAKAPATAKTVEVPQAGSYVIYAQDVRPRDANLSVFVPTTAASAEELTVETQEATLEGNEDSWNTTLDGALLEISAYTSDAATTDRNVTATGEAGEVLHYEQAWNSFGAAVHDEHEVHPENFTSGNLDVTMDADGFGGQTSVELAHYVR
jgi:hypothetical protein